MSFRKTLYHGAMKKMFYCFINRIYSNRVVVGQKKFFFFKVTFLGFLQMVKFPFAFVFSLFGSWTFYTIGRIYKGCFIPPTTCFLMLACLSLQNSFYKDVHKHLGTSYAIFLMPSTSFHIYRAYSLLLFFPLLLLPFSLFVSPFLQTLCCLTWNWLECINF